MNFIVVQRESKHGMLIIVTDKDILGKKFEEEKVQLDLTLAFYKGEEHSKEEVKEFLKKGYILHLTGKLSVAVAVEMDLVDPNRILWIQGVPHAEVVLE